MVTELFRKQASRLLSCLVLSCLVLSCLVLSCLVLSCLVLSCLVLSCLVCIILNICRNPHKTYVSILYFICDHKMNAIYYHIDHYTHVSTHLM